MARTRESNESEAEAAPKFPVEQAKGPPIVVVERGEPRRTGPLGAILRLLAALVLLLIVGLLASMLFLLVALLGTGERVTGAIGGLSQIAGSATERARDRAQALTDQFDPAHPPRESLLMDPEFAALRTVRVGAFMDSGAEFTLSLAAIERRAGAASPDQAQYAVVHRRYIAPREARVLGVVVRTDTGEADYYLYKGESFRVGRAYYKVNWVSTEQQELAVARYRSADGLTVPLKFELD